VWRAGEEARKYAASGKIKWSTLAVYASCAVLPYVPSLWMVLNRTNDRAPWLVSQFLKKKKEIN